MRKHRTADTIAVHDTWAWAETTCDGCGHRLAARAPRFISYGPVNPDHTVSAPPTVFHRLECAIAYRDRQVLEAGLRDL